MRIDDRINLRSFRPSDREDLVAGLNNWNVIKWLVAPPHPYRLDHADEFIANKCDDGVTMAVCHDDRVIGGITCDGKRVFGLWLAQPYWGQGIMYRASKQVIDDFVSTHPCDTGLSSSAIHDNLRSRALLRKLGFIEDGTRTVMSVPLQREVLLVNYRM